MTTTTPNPDLWRQYWTHIGNEDWQAARRLLDLSPRVTGYHACYLTTELVPDDADDHRYVSEDLVPGHPDDDRHSYPDEDGCPERGRGLPEPHLDWHAAASRIDAEGFSSTERRLARLVAALTTGQPLDVQDLSLLGSWSLPVWAILLEWRTDGAATLHPARVDEAIPHRDIASHAGGNGSRAGGR